MGEEDVPLTLWEWRDFSEDVDAFEVVKHLTGYGKRGFYLLQLDDCFLIYEALDWDAAIAEWKKRKQYR